MKTWNNFRYIYLISSVLSITGVIVLTCLLIDTLEEGEKPEIFLRFLWLVILSIFAVTQISAYEKQKRRED